MLEADEILGDIPVRDRYRGNILNYNLCLVKFNLKLSVLNLKFVLIFKITLHRLVTKGADGTLT